MIAATVTILDDERLIREGEAAVDGYNKDLRSARERIMPMARGLLAARRKYPANQDFGDWLQTSSYREILADDRAALIKIGDHADFAAKYIRTTVLISPQTIWEAISDLLPSSYHTITPDPVPLSPETNANSSSPSLASDSECLVSQENPDLPSPARGKHPLVGNGTTELKDPSKAELIKTLEITADQYVTLMSNYPSGRQRSLRAELTKLARLRRDGNQYFAGKAYAQKLFQIALDVVRTGKTVELSNVANFDARIFMPDVPEAFCKYFTITSESRKKGSWRPGILIERLDRIVPLNALALELKKSNRSAAEVHAELLHYWEHGNNMPPKVEKPVALAPDDSKQCIKHEVKFCSERIWPKDSLKHVTYDDMNTGWHLMSYWARHLEFASPQKPKEVAVQLRHLIRDLQKASSIKGLTDVMLACMSAYSKRNEGKDKADLTDNVPPGVAR